MLEWKKLGDVANLIRGKVLSKDYIRDNKGIYPVYSSQTANDGVLGCIDTFMFNGDYLTWTTDGAYAGTIFRRKGKFNITNVCGLIDIHSDSNIIQDYLYYWLSLTAKSYVLEGMGNPKLMSNVASTIRIPIPSKSEQERIVSILDTFTSSIANLKEQIKERRKQYEHYRDQLLKQIDKVECIKQNCVIIKGTYITKKDTTPGCIPVILGGQEPAYYIDKSNHEGKAIVISRSGASAGYVSFWNEPIFVTDGFLIEPKNETLLIEYLFHALKNKQSEIQSLKRGAGVPHITTNHINEFVIPKPSLQTQSRIVSILDQFEASIANLEAQLKEREKQYEYYRNQLLTFE